jgi:hypothetical protein
MRALRPGPAAGGVEIDHQRFAGFRIAPAGQPASASRRFAVSIGLRRGCAVDPVVHVG